MSENENSVVDLNQSEQPLLEVNDLKQYFVVASTLFGRPT